MEDCSDLAREAQTTVTPGGSITPGILGSRDSRQSYAPPQALFTLGTAERSSRSLVSPRCYLGSQNQGQTQRSQGLGPESTCQALRRAHLPFRAVGASASLGVSSPSVEQAHGTHLPARLPPTLL